MQTLFLALDTLLEPLEVREDGSFALQDASSDFEVHLVFLEDLDDLVTDGQGLVEALEFYQACDDVRVLGIVFRVEFLAVLVCGLSLLEFLCFEQFGGFIFELGQFSGLVFGLFSLSLFLLFLFGLRIVLELWHFFRDVVIHVLDIVCVGLFFGCLHFTLDLLHQLADLGVGEHSLDVAGLLLVLHFLFQAGVLDGLHYFGVV